MVCFVILPHTSQTTWKFDVTASLQDNKQYLNRRVTMAET